jgi:hypothetical protein
VASRNWEVSYYFASRSKEEDSNAVEDAGKSYLVKPYFIVRKTRKGNDDLEAKVQMM